MAKRIKAAVESAVRGSVGEGGTASRNIRRIADLEQDALHQRTVVDRVSDVFTRAAGSGTSVVFHSLFFAAWLAINTGRTFIPAFDPFPFNLLTTVVSLEAIFLAIFVLISQNRMAHQGDRRAHLDLQIDLLAEQELTMALRMLERVCEKVGVEPERRTKELEKETVPKKLINELKKNLPDY